MGIVPLVFGPFASAEISAMIGAFVATNQIKKMMGRSDDTGTAEATLSVEPLNL